MADTTFVAQSTIFSTWLNAINNWIYRGANPLFVTSTGAANNYTITLPTSTLVTALTTGMQLTFKAHQTNSGAATITVIGASTLGPTAVQVAAAALVGGEITNGATVAINYNGTSWQLVSTSGTVTAGTLPVPSGGTGKTSFTSGTLLTGAGTGALTESVAGVNYGYAGVPQNSQNAGYTLVLGDVGKHIYMATAGTFTIPANSSVAFPIGTAVTFVNLGSSSTIPITTDTMYLAGTGTVGTRTLAQYGLATAIKVASTTWVINGTGLT